MISEESRGMLMDFWGILMSFRIHKMDSRILFKDPSIHF